MFWSYLLMLMAELCYGRVLCCKADPLHCVTGTCNATTMHHSSGQYVHSYLVHFVKPEFFFIFFLVVIVLCFFMLNTPVWVCLSLPVIRCGSFFTHFDLWHMFHQAQSNHQGVLPNCLWTALIYTRAVCQPVEQSQKNMDPPCFCCSINIAQFFSDPAAPYTQASATDVMMLGLIWCLPELNICV